MVIPSKSVSPYGVRVKIVVQHDNKEPFWLVSDIPIDMAHQEADIVRYVLDGFYSKCMPDGTPTPNVLSWEFGDWKLIR